MSDTHFEISRKMVYSIGSFLVMCLVGLLVYTYQTDWSEQKEKDRVQLKAIQTSQQAIQETTDGMIKNRQNIAVHDVKSIKDAHTE